MRFTSPRHRDVVRFVRPGEHATVVLERTNVIEVQVTVREGAELPDLRLAVSPPEGLFLDNDAWENVVTLGYGRCVSSKTGPGAFYQVSLPSTGSATVLLRDLQGDLPFRLQVLGSEKLLAERACAVGAGDWQTLEIEVP